MKKPMITTRHQHNWARRLSRIMPLKQALVSLFWLWSFYALQAQNYSNVVYVPLYDANSFANRGIDVSNPDVGATSGSHNITPTGGAAYSIPLSLPAGTNEMEPSLSINYSSQGGDGLLGIGWSVSGLSMIGRIGKDIFHDGEMEGVKVDATDLFALDGNRLVKDLSTAVYGANNTTYSTESETFSRVQSHGTLAGGPAYFTVETKTGLTYEYGNTADSRSLSTQTQTAIFWMVNKVTDKFGNYLTFTYKNDLDCPRISEIKYTGNVAASVAPYNSIKFNYVERQDVNTTFIVGTPLKNSFLLSDIEIKTNGQLYRKYECKYGFDNVHSFLTEIVEHGNGGTAHYNSTIFKYGDVPVAFDAQTTNTNPNVINSSLEEGEWTVGDFNGDGYSDIVSFTGPQVPISTHKNLPQINKFSIFINDKNGGFYSPYVENLPFGTTVVCKKNAVNPRKPQVADFDGDGKDDIIVVNANVSAGTPITAIVYGATIFYTILNSTGGIIGATSTFHPANMLNPNGNIAIKADPDKMFLQIADFDGDSRSDFILIADAYFQPDVYVHFPAKGTFANNLLQNGTALFNGEADQVHITDFDGNGRNELMLMRNGQCEFVEIRNTGTYNTYSAYLVHGSLNAALSNKDNLIFPADFNGDGKTDILYGEPIINTPLFGTSTTTFNWAILYSTGEAFETRPFSLLTNYVVINSTSLNMPLCLVIGDFDGDGKSDIIHSNHDFTTNASSFDVYYSKGVQFYVETKIALTNGFQSNQKIGDFNSDGKGDLIGKSQWTNDNLEHFYFKPNAQNNLLDKIADGFNYVADFDYKSISHAGNHYTKGNSATYPIQDLSIPLYVTTQVSVPDGLGGTISENYQYTAAKFHKTGKGFLGFEQVRAENSVSNTQVTTEFELDATYLLPMIKKTSTKLLSTNSLLLETNITNNIVSASNNRFFTRVEGSSSTDHLTGNVLTTTLTYDNYGNVLSEVANINNLQTTTTTNVYGQYGAWIPNKPTTTTITKSTGFIKTVKRSFNTLGALIWEKDFFGTPKMVTTTSTYNSFGLPLSSEISASSLPTKNLSYQYDAKGRFITHITNELGQTSSTSYHAVWGLPLVSTNISGIQTKYDYNDFGNPIGKTERYNTAIAYTTTNSLHWDTQNGTIFYTHTQAPAAPDAKKWYNILGKNVKAQVEAANGNWVESTQTYNNKGQVVTDNDAYFVGSMPTVTRTYTYDNLNRPYQVWNNQLPTPITYSYSYANGNSTGTVIDYAQKTTTKTVDALGRVISSTDNGGTVTMEYPDDFTLINKVNGNELTRSLFDIYGKQISLIDKNAGTSTYSYDAFGQLTSQTDANGNTTTMAYDIAGRIQTRTGVEGVTTYEYYPTGNGINQIKKVTGFSGTVEEYQYDTYDRLLKSTETISGVPYLTTFGYNQYDENINVTYPGGLNLVRTFDTNGYLQTVADGNGTTFFTAGNRNAAGQYEDYLLGNGATSHISYDAFGRPQHLHAYINANSPATVFQDLEWTYDNNTGNVLSRKDNRKSKLETFTYDNLDRLTASTVAGLAPINMVFADNGNILAKTDAGSNYTYHPTKPNALIDVAFPANTGTASNLNRQDIAYTAFQQPASISENGYILSFTYGADYERRVTTLTQNGTLLETRTFLGNYEKNVKNGVTKEIYYISGGDGLCAIAVKQNGSFTYYYTYTDALGSILTLTDATGNIVAEQNFDAWGRYRNPNTWDYNNLPTQPDWLYRGYTGHEHLAVFGLINMNGRLYDPVLGRMLSPDNYIQSPLSTQSYNRYSYVWNNPMKYSDPSGEVIPVHLIVGALVGAWSGYQVGKAKGATGWTMVGYVGGGAVIGTAAAAIGPYVAGLAGPLLTGLGLKVGSLGFVMTVEAISGTIAGVVSGSGMSILGGERKAGNIIWQGVKSGAVGAATGAIFGAAVYKFLPKSSHPEYWYKQPKPKTPKEIVGNVKDLAKANTDGDVGDLNGGTQSPKVLVDQNDIPVGDGTGESVNGDGISGTIEEVVISAGGTPKGLPRFTSVESLIESLKFKTLRSGISEGEIYGESRDAVFEGLRKQYKAQLQVDKHGNSFFKSGDIRVGTHTSTSPNGSNPPTLDITNTISKVTYKIRFY